MGNNRKRKWTVFFLVKADGPEIAEVIKMVNEIRSIPIIDELSIVFCFKIRKVNVVLLENGDTNPQSLENSENKVLTNVFYKLVPSKRGTLGSFPNSLDLIDENPDFDITDPDHLEGYFRKNILNPNKAKRYLLFTFDHGNAFRIFTEEPTPSGDRKTLTMEELGSAIHYALGGKKIDLAIMMNCYMHSIMAGYALRKSVKYLVAPETDMPFKGYNYLSIFAELLKNPKISGKKLAKNAVSSISFKINLEATNVVGEYNDVALFVTELSYLELFSGLINQIVEVFLTFCPIEIIEKVRPQDMTFGVKNDLLDLNQFLMAAVVNGFFEKRILPINTILALMNLSIIDKKIGIDLLSSRQRSSIFYGLSIYFPTSQILHGGVNNAPSYQQFISSEFGRKTNWKMLLKHLEKKP